MRARISYELSYFDGLEGELVHHVKRQAASCQPPWVLILLDHTDQPLRFDASNVVVL